MILVWSNKNEKNQNNATHLIEYIITIISNFIFQVFSSFIKK